MIAQRHYLLKLPARQSPAMLQRTEASGERGGKHYLLTQVQMRQRDVAALDAKYTKELADAKAENDALRDDVAAGRHQLLGCTSKQSVSQCVKPPPPPAWIMQPPPHDWQTPLNGIISPSEREADHYAKTTGRKPRSILMSSAVIELPISMGRLMINYCEQYTRASSGVITCLK